MLVFFAIALIFHTVGVISPMTIYDFEEMFRSKSSGEPSDDYLLMIRLRSILVVLICLFLIYGQISEWVYMLSSTS